MDEEKSKLLLSFESEIKNDGSFEIPKEKLYELRKSGTSRIKVDIFSNPVKDKVNRELFEKVKNLQSLPDEVVYGFLTCKGSLSDTDFNKKVKF